MPEVDCNLYRLERIFPLLYSINISAVNQRAVMQPRIYTYKITFEEVPYYYYGSKKEKYYNQKYFGSPVSNKWCWKLYTPKKQILEFFDFSDKGYEECKKVEDRLISPFLNDPYCLNERCGGAYSLDIRRKTGRKVGLKHKENGTGVCGISEEFRKEIGKKGGLKSKQNGTGVFSLSKEQKSEIALKNKENGVGIFGLTKKQRRDTGLKCEELAVGIFSRSKEEMSIHSRKIGLHQSKNNIGMFSLSKEQKREIALKNKENGVGLFSLTEKQRKENSRKAGLKCKQNSTGIFSLTAEQRSELGKNFAKKVNSQRWMCLETGYISNPGALTNYQRARGIDTSKRKKVS